ncbi:mRNA 3'-end-processing protein RNA15 [Nakaseomyces bracarensis]|uniref:mRNA 3'-end-processing protein RNA15 n=1 Tax=Nakaseomyces bracarensis TaxID=273131 RepID=A0ABR4NNE0_9SACH
MNRGNAQVQNNPPSRVVYVGSIPYDQTEEQILDLCSNVGPVVSLKMMFDPQTGKSKGYAFVQFRDLESSASAVRNLNGYQLGSRLLKCGYSSNSDISEQGVAVSNSAYEEFGDGGPTDSISARFPQLPQGVDVNINMTTPAMMISSELAKKSPAEQKQLLKLFQNWTRANPEDAVLLLQECPQLSFVIAELLLTTGISKVDELTQLASLESKNNSNSDGNTLNSDVDPQVRAKQIELLRQVLQLNDSEIAVLPYDEKMIIWDLKQKALRGEFGAL